MEKSNASLRLEKLREQQENLRKKIRQQEVKINKIERKERARQLIEFGELIEIAGLLEIDKEILLGGLIELAGTLNVNEYKKSEWKQIGEKILEKSEMKKKVRHKTYSETSNTEELLDETEETNEQF